MDWINYWGEVVYNNLYRVFHTIEVDDDDDDDVGDKTSSEWTYQDMCRREGFKI